MGRRASQPRGRAADRRGPGRRPPDLPLGTTDPDILLWAEREDRILLSQDVHTMPAFLADHLAAGRRSPGVLIVRQGALISTIVALLELAAHAGEPADFADRVTFIP